MRTWIPHLAAAGVIAACIWLTLWQLDRADQKRDLIERAEARAPEALARLSAPYDLPRPVVARGVWLAQRQVLLDNKVREHVPGVFVLTPLRLTDGRVFLVNRGWAGWSDRSAPLPDPRPRAATNGGDSVRISGVLNRAPGVGARMGRASGDSTGWPRLKTWLDPASLEPAFGREPEPAVIQLDPNDPAHLTGDDWVLVTFGPERHLGYALTWSCIAVVVAGLWLGLSLRQRRGRIRESEE